MEVGTTCVPDDDPTGTTSTGDGAPEPGDGAPASCVDADYPVMARLCGGGGPPCVVKRDESFTTPGDFRNDAPALALRGDCRPLMLFYGGFDGFYAERVGEGAWEGEPLPQRAATGSLEYSPARATALAMLDDAAFGVSLWRRRAGVWTRKCTFGGKNHARSQQLARDPSDHLYFGHVDGEDRLQLDLFDGTSWSRTRLDERVRIDVRLALTSAAIPNLVYWTSGGKPPELWWLAPSAAPERLASVAASSGYRTNSALVLAPGDVPWVLFEHKLNQQGKHAIVLAHRNGPNDWTQEILAEETPESETNCLAPPLEAGLQCAEDYREHHPIAVFASSDDIRALYVTVRFQRKYVSECMPHWEPECRWELQSDDSNSQLRLAWPGSLPAEHEVVAQDIFAARAGFRLDPGGNMHLAVNNDELLGIPSSEIRYLMIGP
ncbi:hypothetical protein [Nannocystis pusilla]|uniref:hypothetical protein n=1 Tax=Nannocystis pusilla TaxID=889268 RepID=UPI003BF0BC74